MVKKCIYCSAEVPDESVIDFCDKCGIGVWGEKMFKTIVNNMETARDNGDLCHHKSDEPAIETMGKSSSPPVGSDFQTNFR